MAEADVWVSFGADSSALEAGLAGAKAQINALANELRTLAKEMQSTGASAESDLGQHVLQTARELTEAKEAAARFKEELKGQKEEAAESSEVIEGLSENVKRLAELFGIALGVDAFKEWVASMTEAAEKIETVAAKLGLTTTEVQQLQAIAKLTGTDFDEMVQQIGRLQLALAKTDSASSPALHALQALGINAEHFRSLQVPAQLEALSESFSRFADGPRKTAIAYALLGKSGVDMIPYLNKGKEGLEELLGVAERTGVIMSGETVSAFAETKEKLSELSLAGQAFSQNLFGVVQPAVDAAVGWFTRLLKTADPSALKGSFAQFTADLGKLTEDVSTFCRNAMGPIGDLVKLANGLADALNKTVEAENAIAARSKSIQGGHSIADDIQQNMDDFDNAAAGGKAKRTNNGLGDLAGVSEQILAGRLKSDGTAAADALRKMAEAGHDIVVKTPPPKPQAPQMNLGNAGAAGKDALKDFDADALKAQDAAKKIETILDGELKTKQITMSEWVAQTVAALNVEQAAVEAAYKKEIAVAGLTAEQKKHMRDKEAHDVEEITRQIIAGKNKGAEEVSQKWLGAMSTLNGALEGQVSGLLTGVTTWRNAVKNVLTSLTEDIIKFFLKWGLESAENVVKQLLGIGQVTTGVVAGQATQTAAMAAGAAAQKGINATTITGDASRAAAGAYAAVAGVPIIGPILAPIAAGVAFAGVEAFGSFDTGAWSLPSDMTARVHQGEMIVPAAHTPWVQNLVSNAAGGAGRGSGADVHSHVHLDVKAMDGQSVSRVFHDNSDHLLRAIRKEASRGGRGALTRMARGLA